MGLDVASGCGRDGWRHAGACSRAGLASGALSGPGVPKDSVIRYETDLKANKFLLVASGTAVEVERARAILVSAASGQGSGPRV
jgi:hypothetical protein